MRITAIKNYQTNMSYKPQIKPEGKNDVSFCRLTSGTLSNRKLWAALKINTLLKRLNDKKIPFNTTFERCMESIKSYIKAIEENIPLKSISKNEQGEIHAILINGQQTIQKGPNIFLMPKLRRGETLLTVEPIASIIVKDGGEIESFSIRNTRNSLKASGQYNYSNHKASIKLTNNGEVTKAILDESNTATQVEKYTRHRRKCARENRNLKHRLIGKIHDKISSHESGKLSFEDTFKDCIKTVKKYLALIKKTKIHDAPVIEEGENIFARGKNPKLKPFAFIKHENGESSFLLRMGGNIYIEGHSSPNKASSFIKYHNAYRSKKTTTITPVR